jgi:soluble lytic murein transglycosylase-like protein
MNVGRHRVHAYAPWRRTALNGESMRYLTALCLLISSSAMALDPAIADAVAMGACDTVIAELVPPATEAERLALGSCLRRADPEAALQYLPAAGVGPLAEYGRWQRAEVLMELGRAVATVEVLLGLELPGAAGLQVRLLRGRALISQGKSLEAREDLRVLLNTEVGDEARYWLAIGGRDRGDLQAAISTFQRTWTQSVRGPWSSRSAEALKALGNPVPDVASATGQALVADRIASLRRVHRHGEALELVLSLREVTALAPDHALAWAYFRGRQYEQAVSTWAALMGSGADARGPAAEMFHMALAQSRTGDYDAAALVYRQVIQQHPSTKQGDEASYKLGYLNYDRGNCAPAIEAFAAHLKRYPSSRMIESTLWFTGRCHWKDGRHDDAVAAWDRLAAAKPRSSLVPAAAYWKARRLGLQGDPEAERAALQDVVNTYPVSGHAWFASQRIDMPFPSHPPVEPPAWPASLAVHPAVVRSRTLSDAGFRQWAAVELAPVESLAKQQGRAVALAAAHAFIRVGAYKVGKRLASPFCVSPWKGGDPVAQQACNPQAEGSIVTRTALRYDLTPLLPFGIMWSESAMTPSVTSIAGARGLMQLMPREGARLHEEAFGSSVFDPDDLYRASYNACMGTTELGLKRQSLGDALQVHSLPAVIASYNAGEEAVRRWLSASEGPPPFDEFAEDISYTETRRYVRGVLGHLMTYRWVYGD